MKFALLLRKLHTFSKYFVLFSDTAGYLSQRHAELFPESTKEEQETDKNEDE